ncbi:MAG TPA: bile acid:sodium symporter [Spirochaetota bacterium]|nr:bile acid:sodium symporter [Spirochaetota bacterium]
MSLKKIFLPAGLITAVLSALSFPEPGTALKNSDTVPLLAAMIFLVNGYKIKFAAFRPGRKLVYAFSLTLLISLGFGPFLGLTAAVVYKLSPVFTLGLIIISAAPTTLSSATVITELSSGNIVWALFFTIGLNIAAVFTIPLTLNSALSVNSSISVNSSALLIKLVLIVLLPLAAGYTAQQIIKKQLPALLSYIPSLCVILTVWATLSASARQIKWQPQLLYLILAAVSVHTVLLLLNYISGSLLKLSVPDKKAVLFTGSQKTLPIAVSVLAMLKQKNIGAAVIVFIVFHFFQLIFDSTLAVRMTAK